jgi:hypothetical protein
VVASIDKHDLLVADSDLGITHATGHFLTFEDVLWVSSAD